MAESAALDGMAGKASSGGDVGDGCAKAHVQSAQSCGLKNQGGGSSRSREEPVAQLGPRGCWKHGGNPWRGRESRTCRWFWKNRSSLGWNSECGGRMGEGV